MADEEDDVVEDEEIEEALREARIPEFVWEHSLRSLGHDMLADTLDREDYGNGHILVITGADFHVAEYDILWYTTAKHLVLQELEVEFLSLRDVANIMRGAEADTTCDHIFIEGFVHRDNPFPLSPGTQHDVRQQIREWIMKDRCVYPYVQGDMADMIEWWGEDFTRYLSGKTTDYFYNH